MNKYTQAGAKLRRIRKQLGMQAKEAKALIGVSQSTITSIEQGAASPVTMSKLLKKYQAEAGALTEPDPVLKELLGDITIWTDKEIADAPAKYDPRLDSLKGYWLENNVGPSGKSSVSIAEFRIKDGITHYDGVNYTDGYSWKSDTLIWDPSHEVIIYRYQSIGSHQSDGFGEIVLKAKDNMSLLPVTARFVAVEARKSAVLHVTTLTSLKVAMQRDNWGNPDTEDSDNRSAFAAHLRAGQHTRKTRNA